MGALQFLKCLVIACFVVTLRRLRHGPLLPSWRLGYEVLTAAQKRFHRHVAALTPQAERKAWASLRARGKGLKNTIRRVERVGSTRVIWYAPKAAPGELPIILYLHGGGFIAGSEASHGEICARLSLTARTEVGLLEYELAPEHPFPAALETAVRVYQHLVEAAGERRIFLAGDSAGGHLVLSLLFAIQERGLSPAAGAILVSPWIDLTEGGGSMIRNAPYDWAEPWMFTRWRRHYLAASASIPPLAAPLSADLSHLPPLFVTVGGAEMLRDQVEAFVEKARRGGVAVTFELVPERVHLWISWVDVFPELYSTFESIERYIEVHASPRENSSASAPSVLRAP